MKKQDELWQEFASNGLAKNNGRPKEEYEKNGRICGAAHVWVWRRRADEAGVEVLVQLRDANKKTWPNYWDISTAGHVDFGETVLEAAVREAEEEIDLKLDLERMDYVFCIRDVDMWYEELQYVFLYEMIDESEFKINDGEVTELKWVPLAELKEWVENPDGHQEKFVPHESYYFAQLFEWLERVNERREG